MASSKITHSTLRQRMAAEQTCMTTHPAGPEEKTPDWIQARLDAGESMRQIFNMPRPAGKTRR